jgi:hypothetical protein
LGSAGAAKRQSKNDFMHHQTSRTMHPICHGNMATVSKTGPTITVGSAKAQGSKVKPVYGSELPRATRVRDEATQRMTNILAHPVPHLGAWHPQASYLSLDREVSLMPLCELASSRLGFLRG